MPLSADVLRTLMDASPLAAVFITALVALSVVALALSKIPNRRGNE
jgi:hypothetical protein